MTKYPKINYIGNKEKILDWIISNIPADVKSIFDCFSGGGSVSYIAKEHGYKVISNDILKINYHIAKALVENNSETLTGEDIEIIFQGEPIEGFVYSNYSNVYYFPEECKELDLYRRNIEKLDSEYKKSLALILMRRAMIRKMPYSRFNIKWDKVKQLRDEEYSYLTYGRRRHYHNQSFKFHFLDNLAEYNNAVFTNQLDNKALNLDIFKAIQEVNADLVYIDPPYAGTMNNYFSFYGFLDEYIAGEKLSQFENNFTDKKTVEDLFRNLFSALKKYKYWMLSYNSISYPTKEQIISILEDLNVDVQVIEKPFCYKVTGKEKKNSSSEYLFIIKNQ